MLEWLLGYERISERAPREIQVLYVRPPSDEELAPGQDIVPICLRVPNMNRPMHYQIGFFFRLVVSEDQIEEVPDGAIGILPDGFAFGY